MEVPQTVLVDTHYEEGHSMATLMYNIECSQVHSKIECTTHSYTTECENEVNCLFSSDIQYLLTVTSYT